MLAKRLASLLAEEAMKTDLSEYAFDDMAQRFESLRGFRLLPVGRTKNVTHLSLAEIAAAILSIVTVRPGYAGLAATTLKALHPVGGEQASFQHSATFGKAIESAIGDDAALKSLIEVRVSDSEIYTNAYGRAAIAYHSDDAVMTAHYIGGTSLTYAGSDQAFNPRAVISSVVTETVFYPPFFRRIANELKRESSAPPTRLAVDPEDEDEETRKLERAGVLASRPIPAS